MPRSEQILIYKFDELSPSSKEKAREWFREGALNEQWWELTYEDARNVGIDITEFDIDRLHIQGKFLPGWKANKSARTILKEHGDSTETYKLAAWFLKKGPKYKHGTDLVEEEFLRHVLQAYLDMLRKEMVFQLSDENVDESIRINEYDFYKNGRRCTEFEG